MCFLSILYYANLAPASGEDLVKMAQRFQSTGHEHLIVLFTSTVGRFST